MQENHSFDNYFGTYPGADGFPPGTCVPVRVDEPAGECVEPFWIGEKAISDLGHTEKVFRAQLNAGENDGFIEAFADEGDPTEQAMGYYDDRDIPYYWNVADEYVLFDRFFTSAGGGSVWNHMYWVAGVPGNPEGDSIPAEGFGDIPTIFDRLEEAGVSWKFYVQNYDPSITYPHLPDRRRREQGRPGGLGPAAQLRPVPRRPRAVRQDRPARGVLPRISRAGTLPSVAYIVPSGASEHPPGSIAAGERFVRTLHTALMRSSAWDSSAFLWTYDDWGGWYDHVVAAAGRRVRLRLPRADAARQSRTPSRGHIESTTLDFTSGLKFIENNWGVEPLAARDAAANDITGAFDFDAPPRPAELLPDHRDPPPEFLSPQRVIYVVYGAALLLPPLLLGAVTSPARWRRRART